MFYWDRDKTVHVTRGDIGVLPVTANIKGTKTPYVFSPGEVLRLKVFEKKDCNCVIFQKDVEVKEATELVSIPLDRKETRIGEVIDRPKDYWYEVELNPDTAPQTIICYDENGPKVFKLYPEGAPMLEA